MLQGYNYHLRESFRLFMAIEYGHNNPISGGKFVLIEKYIGDTKMYIQSQEETLQEFKRVINSSI